MSKTVTGIQIQVNGMVTIDTYKNINTFISSIGEDTPFDQPIALVGYLKGDYSDFFKNAFATEYSSSLNTYFFQIAGLRKLTNTPTFTIISSDFNWEQSIIRFMLSRNENLASLYNQFESFLGDELRDLHQINSILYNDKLKNQAKATRRAEVALMDQEQVASYCKHNTCGVKKIELTDDEKAQVENYFKPKLPKPDFDSNNEYGY